MTVPEWLQAAVAEAGEPARPRRGDAPTVGDVWLCDNADLQGPARLVAVLELHEDHGLHVARIALIEDDAALATDTGVIVAAGESDLGYDIAVEAMLTGTVWACQLTVRCGHIYLDKIAAVRAVTAGDNAPAGVLTGVPLQSDDSRLARREEDGAALHRLAGDCESVILHGIAPVAVDASQLWTDDNTERFCLGVLELRDLVCEGKMTVGYQLAGLLLERAEQLLGSASDAFTLVTLALTDVFGACADRRVLASDHVDVPDEVAEAHPVPNVLAACVADATRGRRCAVSLKSRFISGDFFASAVDSHGSQRRLRVTEDASV